MLNLKFASFAYLFHRAQQSDDPESGAASIAFAFMPEVMRRDAFWRTTSAPAKLAGRPPARRGTTVLRIRMRAA